MKITTFAALALTAGATKAHFDRTVAMHPTAAEEFAQVFKFDQGDSGGTSNALPISTGVIEDVGDVFCIGGLVTDLAAFDEVEERFGPVAVLVAKEVPFLLWTAAPRLMEISAETLDKSMPYAAAS